MRLALVAIGALALAGCQTDGFSAREPIAPANYKEQILANKNSLWKDSDSIKNASIARPIRNQFLPQWHVCVRLNAKNGFGAYTGERDTVIRIFDDGSRPDALDAYSSSTRPCNDAPHEPFPQLNGKATS